MPKVIFNCRIFDGQTLIEKHALLLEGSCVKAVVPESRIPAECTESWDLHGNILAPGLIDIQVNGGGGVMFNDQPSVESIRRIGEAHRRFGTTGFLPTLISTDFGTMKRAIEAVDQAIMTSVPGVLGIHLEGPFLNPQKCGIHDADRFVDINHAAIELLTSLENGTTLVTLAPELFGQETIKKLLGYGLRVFAGHSNATYEETREALQAGLHGFTHLFNAMSPLEARQPGMVGAALADRDSWFGIIADGQHVHPASLALAVTAKRKGHAILVTDAMATVGAENKTFVFDGQEIRADNGCCRNTAGELAGSDLDMISAVRNTVNFTGLDYQESLRMASIYPARALGIDGKLGFIRPGYNSNFIEIDDRLQVFRTWIDGEVSN